MHMKRKLQNNAKEANTHRRKTLKRMFKSAVFMGLPLSNIVASSTQERTTLISAAGNSDVNYSLAWITENNETVNHALSGFRGHSVVQHPIKKNTALLVARRPGTRVIECDFSSGEIREAFSCRKNHHLFGHACFDRSGSIIITCEADYKHNAGKIVLRDTLNYKVIEEYSSHGIGPHEIKFLPKNAINKENVIVIANGGLLTHPDSGRKVLNTNTMFSSLDYMDLATGELIDRQRVPESKASIRHIDVAQDGTVAISMQLQREATGHTHLVPLTATHRLGSAIKLLEEPQAIVQQLNDYVGSVAISKQSRIAGFTSPRGNIVAFWNIDNGNYQGYHRLHDVCGITTDTDQQHFFISNSQGEIRKLNAHTLQELKQHRIQTPGIHWDNHLSAIHA